MWYKKFFLEKSSVSEFKDNNAEDIVIIELVADLCSAKNKVWAL